MKIVYIASPLSIGSQVLNIRKSIKASDKIFKTNKLLPFCPLLYYFYNFISFKTEDEWLKITKKWVTKSDILLRLSGESKGADEEVKLAKKLNIKVYYDIDELLNV